MDPEEYNRRFLEHLAEMADKWEPASLTTTTDIGELLRAVGEYDVVMGVWNDDKSEFGTSFTIIKGEGEFSLMVYTEVLGRLTWTAIRCRDRAQALAIKEIMGDTSKLV